jgi:hypothetical protein
MTKNEAKFYMEVAYREDKIQKAHMIRVAKNVKRENRAVAYLHDVVEDGHYTIFELYELGLSLYECWALRLLTRTKDVKYFDYIKAIKAAEHEPWGEIAMEVKLADNEDNLTREHRKKKPGEKARYTKARKILLAGDTNLDGRYNPRRDRS